jgi:hypothetical protein
MLGSGTPCCCINPALVLMYSSPEAALAQLAAALNHSSDSLSGAPKQEQTIIIYRYTRPVISAINLSRKLLQSLMATPWQ